MDTLIEDYRQNILALAESKGLRNVRVFGSMSRGDNTADSDVDFLVDLDPDCSALALGGFLMDVSDLLHRKVDVVTEKSLHPKLRERVLREAIPL